MLQKPKTQPSPQAIPYSSQSRRHEERYRIRDSSTVMIRPVDVRCLLTNSRISPLSTTHVSVFLYQIQDGMSGYTGYLPAHQQSRAIVDIQGASIVKYDGNFVASWDGI